MLLKIGSSREPAQEETAVSFLLDCHTRMRHFTELAVQLATAAEATPAARADAAARIGRYLAVALPLHAADEDVSLAPRMGPATDDPALVSALDEMTRQHAAIDDAIAAVQPLLAIVKDNPGEPARWATPLEAAATRLRDLCADHMKLEETVIFPRIATELDDHACRAILDEMRLRRNITR